jgi:DNA-binding transcriptional LysR family regulator
MVRTLASLERESGVALLNRTMRRLHLTDEGRRYLERCRTIPRHLQAAEATVHSRGPTPHRKRAATASALFGRRYVGPIVNEFVQRHPEVTAGCLFVDRVVNLVEEGLDPAVRIGHLRDGSPVAIPLGKVRRVVCARSAYLRSRGGSRRPKEVRAHRCVRFTGLAPRRGWPSRSNRRKVAIASEST